MNTWRHRVPLFSSRNNLRQVIPAEQSSGCVEAVKPPHFTFYRMETQSDREQTEHILSPHGGDGPTEHTALKKPAW